MTRMRTLLCLSFAVGLGACASAPAQMWSQPRPVERGLGQTMQLSEIAYQAGVAAIKDRNYEQALEKLQIAKNADPADARPLNALGVLYDKLGRFDVARRYYLDALDLDPKSETVTHNMAYSAELAALAAKPEEPPPMLKAEIVPAPTVVPTLPVVAIAQTRSVTPPPPAHNPLQTLVAAAVQAAPEPARKPTRERLAIIDATGSLRIGETVRQGLIARKWNAADRNFRQAAEAAHSEIRYDPRQEKLALTLARTLPGKPALIADETVDGVELKIGSDARNWRVPNWQRA